MKTGVIIQARMGSTRLPGKVLKKLKGKTVLEHVVERIKQAKNIDEIIIATTDLKKDSIIEEEANRLGVKVYRGDESDVLSRYYWAATDNSINTIIRVTSDCPLIDPKVLDDIIQYYKTSNCDIVSNAGKSNSSRTFPRGMDTEVFSYSKLKVAFNTANQSYEREHVTPYLYENSEAVHFYKNDVDYSEYRLTLDTEDDFKLISKVYEYLYYGKHDFYLEEIIELLANNPELVAINKDIEQKNY